MISRNLARKIANDEDVDVKFSHNVQMLTDFVDTTILVVIAGRGMSKSTVIQSRRSYRCISVSYTHLDVYKRQRLRYGPCGRNPSGRVR